MSDKTESSHILVVEDDDDHATFITRVLGKLDPENEITRVKDGVEAVAFFDRSPPFQSRTLPDLVLLDLKLPKKGGHEVLERVKSDDKFKNIPIVVLTTSDAELDKKMAYEHHANSYLVKPMEAGQFKSLLSEVNTYWTHLNKLPATKTT